MVPHGATYKIWVKNPFSYEECSVSITIDGKWQGTWILNQDQSYSFERPLNEEKLYTFFATAFAPSGAGIKQNASDNGIIKVQYTPPMPYPSSSGGGGMVMMKSVSMSMGEQPRLSASQERAIQQENEQLERTYARYETERIVAAGATALTGVATQKFGAPRDFKPDKNRALVYTVRLGVDKRQGRPDNRGVVATPLGVGAPLKDGW